MHLEFDLAIARIAEPHDDDLASLSDAERAALGRFTHPGKRRAHVAGRALARRRLAPHFGVAPADVPLRIGELGRPLVGEGGLHVSIAHSDTLACVAVAAEPVGVDIEPLVELPDVERLLAAYATPAEREWIAAGGRSRSLLFLTCWVRKEALLKADGRGLRCDPCDVDTRAAVVTLGASTYATSSFDVAGHAIGVATRVTSANAAFSGISQKTIPHL